MRLRIERAAKEDVYRDYARVPEQYRIEGQIPIPEGSVVRLSVEGRSAYAIARGSGDFTEPSIWLDERLRNALAVRVGSEAEVHFKPAGLIGKFRWALQASDPAYRVAAWLGILSVALGMLGVVLGVVSIVVSR